MASPSHSGGTMHVAVTSPFKFLMGSTRSAPDMSVNTLVDRFTTLEVMDRDEEGVKRTVRRLEAALKRAEMAREEAESEAASLRNDVREQRDLAEERLREETRVRQRLDEYEKKYEKAKERFKQQRAKHEEHVRKMQKEYMEREKLHWRQQQQMQEEVEWERKLRADSNELMAWLEIDHLVALQSQQQEREQEQQQQQQQQTRQDRHQEQQQNDDFDMQPEITQGLSLDTPARSQTITPKSHDSPTTTNTLQPRLHVPTTTTCNQPLRIPINFNDDQDASTSDKENSHPQHHKLQLPHTPLPTSTRTVSAPPMTISCSTPAMHATANNIPDFLNTPIDREAALAAIRERRGRARSNAAGAAATPGRLGRDASAPPGGGQRSKSRAG